AIRMAPAYEICVGLKKGHRVTTNAPREKPANRRGKSTKNNKFVRSVIREIVGYAPYERRIVELLKISKDKRALKFAKRRLGSHLRAKRKREEMVRVVQAQHRKKETKE
ncbi:hypothetical protein BOX15_Mlig023309g2, partial [Macrostomum lignano]